MYRAQRPVLAIAKKAHAVRNVVLMCVGRVVRRKLMLQCDACAWHAARSRYLYIQSAEAGVGHCRCRLQEGTCGV